MEKFDFEKAVKELLACKKIGGKDGVLAPLVKELVEVALEAEIESLIADEILQGKKTEETDTIEKQSNPQAVNLSFQLQGTGKEVSSFK